MAEGAETGSRESGRVSRLIVVRHGLSVWNEQKRFTGGVDIALSNRGVREARRCGATLLSAALVPDSVHTSRLSRAVRTTQLILQELGLEDVPVSLSSQLNERSYGTLEGMTHDEAVQRYGHDAVTRLRRSTGEAPSIGPSSGGAPLVESFGQVLDRVGGYWSSTLRPDLAPGRTVLCVGHGTSVRALTAIVEGMDAATAAALEVPTAEARLYEWDGEAPCPLPGRRMLG